MIKLLERNIFGMLNIILYSRAISKHKHLEVQLSHDFMKPVPDVSAGVRLSLTDTHVRFNLCSIVAFDMSFVRQCDHAGFRIDIDTAVGFFVFTIYDTRHWNYITNDYVNYDHGETNEYNHGGNSSYFPGKVDKPITKGPKRKRTKRK